jgi:endonuclease YncB( thermonuclease family)/membrane-bound metal-dependent hydrolase YbcI (DUF457 family)
MASFGAILPDIDAPESLVGQLTKPISTKIAGRFGHRTFCHSLAGLGAFSVLILPLLFLTPFYRPLIIGYFSHLIADAMTKQGVRLIWPLDYWAVLPGREEYRIRVGTKAENVLLAVLLIFIPILYPICNVGFIGWVGRLTGQIDFTYADYRGLSAAGKEAWIVGRIQDNRTFTPYKGRWQAIGLTSGGGLGLGYMILVPEPDTGKKQICSLGAAFENDYYPTHIHIEGGKSYGVEKILGEAPAGEVCFVTRVIDGDTIVVSFKGGIEHIRLIGIDTPEIAHPDIPGKETGDYFGEDAKRFVERIIWKREVTLTYERADIVERDKYNRILAYVWLEDGTLLNKLLVEEGYARYYPYFPFKFSKEFQLAEAEAQVDGKGLWAL